MPDLVWTCNEGPQDDFLFGDLGAVREVLYGGAKGGGKSEAIGPKVLMHVAEYPKDARVLILRETFPELVELIDRIRPMCKAAGAIWNEQRKTWSFPDGAKVRFGHLSDGCDPYWGHEFTLIIVDEVTRCLATESDYLKLLGSLRNSKGVPCQVVLTSNPGGNGHGWVKARFMGVPPREVQTDANGLSRVYIPAKLADNPHLPPEYRATLEQMSDAERAAYLDGDWDAFEGQVFKLVPGVHVLPLAAILARYDVTDGKIPAHWTRYRSMDWGFAAPFALYWFAIAPDQTAILYREWYGCATDAKGNVVPNKGISMEPSRVGERIAEIERYNEEKPIGIADPSCWSKGQGDHGGGPSVVEVMARHGVTWTPGKNDRLAGKSAVHERLYYGEDKRPGLLIVADAAPQLVRTLPVLEYDRHRIEDVCTTGDDHGYDSLRYFAMARPFGVSADRKPKDGWRKKTVDASNDWMVR